MSAFGWGLFGLWQLPAWGFVLVFSGLDFVLIDISGLGLGSPRLSVDGGFVRLVGVVDWFLCFCCCVVFVDFTSCGLCAAF